MAGLESLPAYSNRFFELEKLFKQYLSDLFSSRIGAVSFAKNSRLKGKLSEKIETEKSLK